MLAIAKVIEARASLGASRQVFLATLGSFDTHTDQLKTQPFFQCLDFQAGPLQFPRQHDDLFGFGTGRRTG